MNSLTYFLASRALRWLEAILWSKSKRDASFASSNLLGSTLHVAFSPSARLPIFPACSWWQNRRGKIVSLLWSLGYRPLFSNQFCLHGAAPRLSPALFESCCTHFWLQVSSPKRFLVALFYYGLLVSIVVLVVISSQCVSGQFHFLLIRFLGTILILCQFCSNVTVWGYWQFDLMLLLRAAYARRSSVFFGSHWMLHIILNHRLGKGRVRKLSRIDPILNAISVVQTKIQLNVLFSYYSYIVINPWWMKQSCFSIFDNGIKR